jgi:hypothetical protein
MIPKPSLVLAVLISMIGPHAMAQSVYTVLSQNGMLGSWSGDCTKAASKENPALIFSAPRSGDGSLVYDTGPGREQATFTIKKASDLNAGRLALRGFDADESSLTDIVLSHSADKIRVLSEHEFGSGKYRIQDGVIAATGAESPSLARCNRGSSP